MNTNILIVEDDQNISHILAFNLQDMGHQVEVCHDGTKGLLRAQQVAFDLLILDLMLPGTQGLDICRTLRQSQPELPILMLTSLDSALDRVLGLEIGADDYVTKPFSVREIQARVKALLRRSYSAKNHSPSKQLPSVKQGPIYINPETREVYLNTKLLELTAKEFDLLYYLAVHAGKVFTRNQLLDKIWGYGHSGYEHTVNTHINRLRNKCQSALEGFECIQTVWGVGYKFSLGPVNTRG